MYDGPDATYPEMVKQCGTSIPSPPVYTSQSNMMYIKMKTDPNITARGFKADYVTGILYNITTNFTMNFGVL